ncbi:HMA domain-containing protein [Cephalotus follicularis]|uniref:HMA domain-containing protein n=1 Tax=Cephalotus follicularis TaxID=3775 RepID=A0A1Q3D2Z7_CEPFO|nr:HMA domain-containing protein [Cephalotus follicularis]
MHMHWLASFDLGINYIRTHNIFFLCFITHLTIFCGLKNMKQKIVIKMQVHCDKCRTKAMEIAAKAEGVVSVAIQGGDKDRLVVTGDDVDAASLICTLKKKVGYSCLVSVAQVKNKKKDEGNEDKKGEDKKGDDKKGDDKKGDDNKESTGDANPSSITYPPICCHYRPQCELYRVVDEPNPNYCTVM